MRDDDSTGGSRPGLQADQRDAALEMKRHRLARLVGLVAIILLIAVIGFGAWGSWRRHEETLTTLSRINEVRTVRTLTVKPNDTARVVSLPGTMEPFDVATLYARATGYIAKRVADFGSHVHAGDVLAVIAAPDLDQQLSQARAQLAQTEAAIRQSQATETLQAATNGRTQTLVKEGWQTKQQGDIDRFNLAADQAAVRAAMATAEAQKADVSRLEKLTEFEKVVAPFDGVITDRQIDVGSLVTADASSGTSLFSIERTKTLRVQVYVPQDDLMGLSEGTSAEVTVPEIPGRTFKGSVSRTASALQAASRTLLVQVDVENPDNVLRSGTYCTVAFSMPQRDQSITVPSQAIIFNKNGLSVAVVEDGKAHLRPIGVAEDNGADLEVRTGLNAGDQVILSPPINLVDGMSVHIAEPPKTDPPKTAG